MRKRRAPCGNGWRGTHSPRGDLWVRHLAFRDHLRSHPEAAAAYHRLKRELSVRCGKEDSTDAKSLFIEGILDAVSGPDAGRTE